MVAGHRQSISKVCDSAELESPPKLGRRAPTLQQTPQGKWRQHCSAQPTGGDRTPVWGSQSRCQAAEEHGLQNRNSQTTFCPWVPFLPLPRTEENAGRRAARAVRACPPPHFILFPFQRLAGSPKGSLVCLLRGEVQVPVGSPSPGWGPSLPDTCPQRLGGRWAGGERSCACVVGREGGGGWTEGRSGGLPHHPTHTTVMGKRRYTLNGHKHDRQTCTLRPPGALDQPVQWGTEPAAAHLPCVAPTLQAVGMGATQPRSPRPGQTMSHGECVGPTG